MDSVFKRIPARPGPRYVSRNTGEERIRPQAHPPGNETFATMYSGFARPAARVETSGHKLVHTNLRRPTVFVVSGDDAVRDSISGLAASAGFRVESFPSLEAWRERVPAEREGCLVVDTRKREPGPVRGLCGLESICAVRGVVLLVGRGDVPTAVRAIREGATDALEMPFRDDRLLESIRHAAGRVRTFERR